MSYSDCVVFVLICVSFFQQWNQMQWDGWTFLLMPEMRHAVNCVLFNIFFYFDSTILFLPAGWPNWKDTNVDIMSGFSIRRQPEVIRNWNPFSKPFSYFSFSWIFSSFIVSVAQLVFDVTLPIFQSDRRAQQSIRTDSRSRYFICGILISNRIWHF